MTYEDSIKYFFGVLNEDFYYTIADNMFELEYDELIKYAKNNGFYENTYKKLKLLINTNNFNAISFYNVIDFLFSTSFSDISLLLLLSISSS